MYTDGPILTNLHRWVDIDKSFLLRQYWHTYIEQLISANQHWKIYPNMLISTSLYQWIDIDECMPMGQYQQIYAESFT